MSYSSLSKPSQPERILVVDDVPDNCLLIQSILVDRDREKRYKITLAHSGAEALAQVETSAPDLVLLDILMPQMDGFEVTRRIRENSQLPFIPILLITASDRPSVSRGLDLGADDFIRKPIEIDELQARVRSLLRLKHSVEERDHIARQREDFVSRLTHDMRTPLVAADRLLKLLQKGTFGEVPPEMERVLMPMINSNTTLLKMVNQLLDVYRYEAGRKPLVLCSINLRATLEEIAQEISQLALEKGLDLRLKLGQEETLEQVTVLGDRSELRRVFANLIDNGIKFTDNGFVEVRLQATEGWVKVEIQDTGPGISPQDKAVLFERFRTGNHTRAGSGLGLYLSRQIVESHKGTLDLQSEVGIGSTFIVLLPTGK